MVPDREGFAYPEVDRAKCVNCGLCSSACPSLHPAIPRRPQVVLAAAAKDEGIRSASSSGGAFSALARAVLRRGGVVYGAGFDGNWDVAHRCVETEDGLAALRGSKYVSSRIEGVYSDVAARLAGGREVLFSGTPCQVKALRNFLRRDYEKLLTVEVVCYAVPSPKAWQSYLRRRRDGGPRTIAGINLREKSGGWNRYSVHLRFADGGEYRAERAQDAFMLAFGVGLSTRPGCARCRMRSFRSGADISIGDFWGVAESHPSLDDDRGVSAVFAHTEKGVAALESVRADCRIEESSYEKVLAHNPVLERNLKPHDEREEFFRRIGREDFDAVVRELVFVRRKDRRIPWWRKLLGRKAGCG